MNNKIRGRKATLTIIDDYPQEEAMHSIALDVPGLPIIVETSIRLKPGALVDLDLNHTPFKAQQRTYGGFTWWFVVDNRDYNIAMFTDQFSAEKVAAALDFYSKVVVVDPTYRA